MSDIDAENDAVRRFGPTDQFARQFDKFALPFRILLMGASVATALVALWLFWVIGFVLPARDPAHIPMWRVVAACFLAYSGLSWAYLVRGPRDQILRWLVLALSAAAFGLGIFGIVQMMSRAAAGRHFEGYIVLMGLILCGHGISAFVYTILTSRIAKQLRAA